MHNLDANVLLISKYYNVLSISKADNVLLISKDANVLLISKDDNVVRPDIFSTKRFFISHDYSYCRFGTISQYK